MAKRSEQELRARRHTRLRQKARFLDAFLQEIGQMYLSRVFQYKTVPQIYRITNDQNAEKYFKFHIENLQDEQTGETIKVAKYREYVEQPDGSMAFGDEMQFQVQGKFDIKVGTGSSLPFAKTEKSGLAFELFDRKIIDAEEVLKTVDWPNKEAVIERLKAQAAEEMAMQQQMEMQKQAGQA